jgi:hypothetical protein
MASPTSSYTYQVAAAALAWLDLDGSGKVYLEVAEDYATVAQRSLAAVQVKDTAESGSVTIKLFVLRLPFTLGTYVAGGALYALMFQRYPKQKHKMGKGHCGGRY